MAVSGVEAVLEFLRKNGLSDSESALMEDLLEKSELRSADFERFFFPMLPPPPPLKIPSMRRRTEAEDGGAGGGGGGDSSDGSAEEEFVSLVSSATDLCSSGTVPFRFQSLVCFPAKSKCLGQLTHSSSPGGLIASSTSGPT